MAKQCLCVLLMVFIIAGHLNAQSESGGAALQGVVTDPSGKVIADASIRIVRPETGYIRALTSDSTGKFQALALPVGVYSIEVSVPGFGQRRYDNVRLEVGQTISLPIEMQIADAQFGFLLAAAAAARQHFDTRQQLGE